jgi:tyrosine-protein phosphatase YwqE
MFSFFTKKKQPFTPESDFVFTDMHSHVLPGLDDGAEQVENSLTMLKKFIELGYKKAILTPHIMGDAYQNTPTGIREKLDYIKSNLGDLQIELACAAEYYIDESLCDKLEKNQEILSFGKNKYVLIETSYINESSLLTHVCFELQSKGYTPILAHPERYTYMYHDFKKYIELFDRGLLFQINLNSLTGYYSDMSKKIVEKLIDHKMVHFVGTDCHSIKQAEATERAKQTKHYQKLKDIPLLNNTL